MSPSFADFSSSEAYFERNHLLDGLLTDQGPTFRFFFQSQESLKSHLRYLLFVHFASRALEVC